MVAPSRRIALNERALRTATWLRARAEGIAETIQVNAEELEKLSRDKFWGHRSKERADGSPVMVTLRMDYLENLIMDMYRQEAELRLYTEPRKSVRRPSPRLP
jgi:hypothetical protein